MDEFSPELLCDCISDNIRKASFRPCALVCPHQIDVALEGDVIRGVQFTGGCSGNTKGIASLVAGMKVDEAIGRLGGIDCSGKGTSCPDQLARALGMMKGK